jgi:hypothetical protein
MGAEAKCVATIGRKHVEGKALLETDSLIFRGGDVRLSIPFAQVKKLDARDGVLHVSAGDDTIRFALGASAPKWAEKIRNPPSRADKLGVKSGQSVLLSNGTDAELVRELTSRGAVIVTRATKPLDAIFYFADSRASLSKLSALRAKLQPDGALWIVRPKGSADISEADVMKAGKSAGLVDVKVVRFSDTHTAEKFVVPVAKR